MRISVFEASNLGKGLTLFIGTGPIATRYRFSKVPKTLEEEITLIAKELNDKKSLIIARALNLYFNELDTLIADNRYKKYKEGKSKTYTFADLDKVIG